MAEELPDWEAQSSGLDPTWVLDVLRRRRLLMLVIAVVALGPALLFAFSLQDVYQAEAVMAIQPTPPVMRLGPALVHEGDLRDRVAATIASAKSDEVLGRVADQVPEPGPARPGLVRRVLRLGPPDAPPPELRRRLLVGGIRGSIEFEAEAGGLLLIRARNTDSGTASFLANATAEALIASKREERERAAQRVLTWLDARIYELQEQVSRREGALAELQPRVKPSARRGDARMDDLLAELQVTRIDLMTTRGQIQALRGALGASGGDGPSEPGVVDLQRRLAEERTALERDKLRFTPNHPEVLRRERIVADLEKRLRGLDLNTETPQPTRAAELEALQSKEAQLAARERALERIIDQSVPTGTDDPEQDTVRVFDRLSRELEADQQMLAILVKRKDETLLSAATQSTGLSMVDLAEPPLGPARSRKNLFLLAALLGSIGLGVAAGFGLELLDSGIRDAETVSSLLGAPLLATVPAVVGKTPPERVAHSQYAIGAESFRNLRTAILFAMHGEPLHSLVVTSGAAGEGKTSVASNLAAAFTSIGRRVLLVDADLRRGRLDRVFALEKAPGLAELIRGELDPEDVVQSVPGERFDVLACGEAGTEAAELLDAPALEDALKKLQASYDLVIFDSAILIAVPDALILASKVQATLLVYKPATLSRGVLQRMRAELERASARVLGLVINQGEVDRYHYSPYVEASYARGGQPPAESAGRVDSSS